MTAAAGRRVPAKTGSASGRPARRGQPAAAGRTAARSPGRTPQALRARTDELRRRLADTRRLLSKALDAADGSDPAIWERGAYLLWLRLVVEQLVVRGVDIEVGDLSTISKMLHDQRKLSLEEARHRSRAGGRAPATPKTTELPDEFGEVVRRIYGINLPDDAETPPAGS